MKLMFIRMTAIVTMTCSIALVSPPRAQARMTECMSNLDTTVTWCRYLFFWSSNSCYENAAEEYMRCRQEKSQERDRWILSLICRSHPRACLP